MMQILYFSCHSTLENLDLQMLADLGYDFFSPGGAYQNPTLGGDGRRPAIRGGVLHPELFSTAMQCGKEQLHPDLIQWADVVWMTHNPKHPMSLAEQPWLAGNWPLIKNKRVIWRSIGQSLPVVERELLNYRQQGMQVVRYSPKERNIEGFAGEDAMIRFYQDENEFSGWVGNKKTVLNFTQSLKQRGVHVGYEVWDQATKDLSRVVYGPGNEDLKEDWGGVLGYEAQKEAYRGCRAYFYVGTAPAAYTLSLIEAMMAGIPVVAAGRDFTYNLYHQDTNEVHDIITNGRNGFVSNDVGELRKNLEFLLDDANLEEAKRIGEEGRKTALALWGKQKIFDEWRRFLG